jgi:hypothetical protein
MKYDDPRVQYLSDKWRNLQYTATPKQKDKVGLAYIAKALGLGDDLAKRFAEGDWEAYETVGQRGNLKEAYKPPDLAGFWARINEIFPVLHTAEETRFLIEDGDESAANAFCYHIAPVMREGSIIMRRISLTFHAWK